MTRGKRSSQRRSAAWRARSDRYDTQRVLIQIELTSLIKQARMKPAADRYNEIIPVLCGCLQTSRKPWLQALWRRMKDQYRTNDVVIIARQWQTLMREQSRASLIYQMVSFDTATGYVGQVAYREQTYERMVEHWRGIRDYDYNGEAKYAFMHRQGGAGSWFFVPYIFCMSSVPKQILSKLEQQEIRLYPMHLNREQRHRRKRMIKTGQYSRLHSQRGSTLPQSGVWGNRPSHTAQLQLYYGNGTVLCKGVDPTLAMQSGDVVLIHSSLIILSQRTYIKRTLGHSIVRISMLGSGIKLDCTLAHCLKWVIQQRPGWVLITFLQKNNKTLVRPLDYSTLLHIAKHKASNSYLKENLSVEQMWIMWAISRRELALPIHQVNISQLTTVLRHRGFTLTPDSELVIKIPGDVQTTRMTVISTLRKALLVSFIPQMVCDHVLRNIRVVRQATKTIGEVLITTKHWIQTMYRGTLPCNCHLYPAEWPRRHGHIFVPSWEYEGPCSHTMHSTMQSTIFSKSSGDRVIATAITAAWRRYLPDFYIPFMKDDATLEAEDDSRSSSSSTSSHTKGLDSSFDSYTVHKLADYLKSLAVMGIDKCTSRCLILCPHLFERYFDETFPVLTDPRHFTPMPNSFTAIARTMKAEYDKQRWNTIAAWNTNCSASVPYPLFKLKDITATVLMSLLRRVSVAGTDLWFQRQGTQLDDY